MKQITALNEKAAYIAQLKKIIIFSFLTDAELAAIMAMAEFYQYNQDEKIIAEGETSPYLYGILQGGVHVMKKEKEKNVYICNIGEHDIFGEAGIFMTVKRTADVISTAHTVIMSIHRKNMLAFFKNQATSGIKILMLIIYSLLKKLKEANQELAFERKTSIDQADIDEIVKNLIHSDS